MALAATGGSSEHVDCGSNAVLDNVTEGTFAVWVYLTSNPGVGTEYGVLGKSSASNRVQLFFNSAPSCNFEFGPGPSGSICRCYVDTSNMPQFGTSKWCFVAGAWKVGGVSTDQKRWSGDLSTLAAEVSTYGTRGGGSYVDHDDSASNLYLINYNTSSASLNGRLAMVQLYNRTLTLAEVRAVQLGYMLTGRILDINLGWPGTTCTDLSGYANHGTVTGATWVAHPPAYQPLHQWQQSYSFPRRRTAIDLAIRARPWPFAPGLAR